MPTRVGSLHRYQWTGILSIKVILVICTITCIIDTKVSFHSDNHVPRPCPSLLTRPGIVGVLLSPRPSVERMAFSERQVREAGRGGQEASPGRDDW